MSRDKKRMGASALLGCRLATGLGACGALPPRSASASPHDSGLVGRSAPWVGLLGCRLATGVRACGALRAVG